MNLDLSTHICAYLDVLGGAELFKCKNTNETEEFIELIIDFERRLNNMKKGSTPVVRNFTDNIFAALPLAKDSKYPIKNQVRYFLSEIAAQLQQILLFSKLPVRGGITIGKLYIDNRIIVGPAVVQAVNLEKQAIHPRVLLDKNVITQIQGATFPEEYFLYTAPDEKVSLNYISFNDHFYNEHKRIVNEKLIEHKSDSTIYKKYKWLLEFQENVSKHIKTTSLA